MNRYFDFLLSCLYDERRGRQLLDREDLDRLIADAKV